jgi:hypothetical protein
MRTFLLIVIVLSRFLDAATADTTELSLWRKAEAVAGKSADLIPASVHVKVVVGDGNGNTKSTQETWSRISVDGNGKLETTVLRSIKDGRDDTENAQRQTDRHPERSRFQYSFLPMMPANRGKVTVSPTRTSRIVEGATCAGYAFRMKGDEVSVGTVWIDESTGAPLLMEFTFEPLPPGAKLVTNKLRFQLTEGGAWHLISMETYGEGQLLFFRRDFRLLMEFSDYFRYTPPEGGTGSSH